MTPEYAGLLDFVASLAIPEQGEAGWKVASAADAYRIAEAEFARRYPGKQSGGAAAVLRRTEGDAVGS